MNATSKLVKAWESKNAKNAAKVGGISMMALSLAACGGSSTTTTATTTTTDTTTTDTTTTVVAGVQKSLLSTTDLQTGGAGDDTFYGLNSGDFATGDIVDGGEGDDTLIASYTSANGATQAIRPVLSNLEAIQLTITDGDAGGDTTTLNLDQSTGVTNVLFGNKAFNGAADTIVLSGVTTAVAVTIQDDAGAATNNANNYTMTYSDAATGTADTASVAVKMTTADGELGTITAANVETLTVSASGGFDATYAVAADAATTLTLNAAADATATDATGGTVSVTAALVTTLNVNASNDLTISDATNGLLKATTINIDSAVADKGVTMTDMVTTNAATATEVLTFNITGAGDANVGENTTWSANNAGVAEDQIVVAGGTSTGDIAYTTDTTVANLVTTGSGDDTVTLGGVLDADDSINLGAGSNDTIAIAVTFGAGGTDNADIFFTDATATDDPTITGVEFAQINVAGTMAAQEFSVGGSTTFADTVVLSSAAAKDVGNNNLTISGLGATQGVKLGSLVDLDSATVIMSLADATGTSDSLSITTDGLNATATATYEGMTVNAVETINLDLASTDGCQHNDCCRRSCFRKRYSS
jgi:hypothetical protein